MPVSITTARRTDNAAAVAQKIAMDDDIVILATDDVPFQMRIGSESIVNIKQQWLSEDLDKQTATVDTASALASTTVSVADSTNIRVNDVLKRVNGTVMLHVTAVNYGNGDLTVVRPFNGSVDEALAVNDVLEIVGQNLVEGADPQDPRDTDMTGDFNWTQIFQEACQATRTARKNEQYGVSDPYAHQVEKKYRELNVRLERAFIHGKRFQSGPNRQMGGLFHYIPLLATGTTTKANFETALNDMLQAAYDVGAMPRILMCSPAVKRHFSSLDVNKVQIQRTDREVGQVKDYYMSDFGRIELVMNRHLPKQSGFLMQEEFIRRLVFDGWFLEPLAKTGDTDKGHIVGEFSLKVKNAKAHQQLKVTDL